MPISDGAPKKSWKTKIPQIHFFGDFGECLMCFGKLVLLNLDDTGNAGGNLAVGVLHRLRL